MRRRPTVFICCPITPRSEKENHAIEFLSNLRAGIEIAAELICKGFAVYCPALDMHYWLTGNFKTTAEDIYEQDISLLLKMDAIFTVGDWSSSPNCSREFEIAWKANIPCFSTVEEILSWKKNVWDWLEPLGKEIK